ncbi:MAG: hypothetical protein AAGC69_12565, partial [Paracraurococcus sp.]
MARPAPDRPGAVTEGSVPDQDPAMTAPPLSDAEALARLRLARTEGIGPLTYQRLLERHG